VLLLELLDTIWPTVSAPRPATTTPRDSNSNVRLSKQATSRKRPQNANRLGRTQIRQGPHGREGLATRGKRKRSEPSLSVTLSQVHGFTSNYAQTNGEVSAQNPDWSIFSAKDGWSRVVGPQFLIKSMGPSGVPSHFPDGCGVRFYSFFKHSIDRSPGIATLRGGSVRALRKLAVPQERFPTIGDFPPCGNELSVFGMFLMNGYQLFTGGQGLA
jgi:hypothetical protein